MAEQDPRDTVVDRPSPTSDFLTTTNVWLEASTQVEIDTQRQPDGRFRAAELTLSGGGLDRLTIFAKLDQLERLRNLIGVYLDIQADLRREQEEAGNG